MFDVTSGTLITPLLNPTPDVEDRFATSVAISEDMVIVGDYRDDTTEYQSGQVYVFRATTGELVDSFGHPDPVAGGQFSGQDFGRAVAASGSTIVVGAPGDDTRATNWGAAYVLSTANGDFNDDGLYDLVDIDGLVAAISGGTHPAAFDLTGDGLVNLADRDVWLVLAGAANLPSGNPYLLGDGNLDGVVDVQDYNIWNSNKFSPTAKWSQADWNADGVADVQDFNIWNSNRFQSSNLRAAPALSTTGPALRKLADHASVPTNNPTTVEPCVPSRYDRPAPLRRIDAALASLHRRGGTVEPADAAFSEHLTDTAVVCTWDSC